MRATSKGQVTIPKDVRAKLGIEPGDEVGFREHGQSIILENLSAAGRSDDPSRDLQKFFQEVDRLRREGGIVPLGMSVDAYMDMIRGYGEDADDPGFQHLT
jgi:AbrB family looped-hinge helix DNA binding protein